MDLRMPVLDGVAAIEVITREQPDIRVLALTSYDGDALNFGRGEHMPRDQRYARAAEFHDVVIDREIDEQLQRILVRESIPEDLQERDRERRQRTAGAQPGCG